MEKPKFKLPTRSMYISFRFIVALTIAAVVISVIMVTGKDTRKYVKPNPNPVGYTKISTDTSRAFISYSIYPASLQALEEGMKDLNLSIDSVVTIYYVSARESANSHYTILKKR